MFYQYDAPPTEMQACATAREITRPLRLWSVPMVAALFAALVLCVVNGKAVLALYVVVIGTVGQMMWAMFVQCRSITDLFSHGSSIGFHGQWLLLGPAAGVAAVRWQEHATGGWRGFFDATGGANLVRWTAIAVVAGLLIAIATRLGERKNYHPLAYFSRLKTVHDWRCHPMAFLTAAFVGPSAVIGRWGHADAWFVLVAIVVWLLVLGPFDLWRAGRPVGSTLRMDRDKLHPRELPEPPHTVMYRNSSLTTAEYFRRLRDLRRASSDPRRPG